jgi:hypothetical protein
MIYLQYLVAVETLSLMELKLLLLLLILLNIKQFSLGNILASVKLITRPTNRKLEILR